MLQLWSGIGLLGLLRKVFITLTLMLDIPLSPVVMIGVNGFEIPFTSVMLLVNV